MAPARFLFSAVHNTGMSVRRLLLLPAVALAAILPAQDYLAKYPQYERYQKMRPEIAGSVVRGDLQVTWADDGKSFRFQRDGKWFRYYIPAKTAVEIAAPDQPQQQQGRGGRGGFPQRGRQFDTANSPDGKRVARHRDRNVYISDTDGKNEQAITTDGNAVTRVKNGIASWVYGEELGVREAMWWSPDSTKLAYYRFDESQVKDYFLAMKVREFQNELDVEAYPKAGAPNPTVMLFVYDLATKKSTKLDVAFDSGAGQDLAHYVYSVRWSPNGSELLFNRTNRKQNVMEFCAANPATGACRVIIREASPSSWTDNSPAITYLAPKAGQPQKFLWQSERTGYNHWFLYDLSGKLHSQVTMGDHEAGQIVTVDEAAGHLYYMARSGATPYLNQLHRVGLDGRGDARLTDPAFSHRVSLAPDKRHVVDVAETIDTPPTTRLLAMDGKVLATLAQSDLAKFEQMGLERVERFTFTTADGKTLCYGTLAKPSEFDASRKYPLVVSVYAGPESGGGIERFQTPDALTELGFLVAWIDGRGTSGRGKAHKDAAYGKLGVIEIDDQAAGVKELAKRPYVDGSRGRSTARLTAAMRQRWRSCATPMSSTSRSRVHRSPTGGTTTRSIPSGTWGSPGRVRTGPATTQAQR